MTKVKALIAARSDRVAPGANLREVAAHMLAARISSVIVVDHDKILGIITERDILHVMRQKSGPEKTARDVMTHPVHSVHGDTDYRQAYREAASRDIRRIVVTDDDGAPLGIVSEADFREFLGPNFFLHLNTVETLMDRSFPRLAASARLDEALISMEASRVSCVVIVEERRPVGIVTEHDVVRLFVGGEANPALGAIMTHPTISVSEDCPLTVAAELMHRHGVRNLTVLDASGHLTGLLSEHALMRPLKLELVDDALTERHTLEREHDLMLSEKARRERYQHALLDNFPFPVWQKDTESRFLSTNRAFLATFGQASGASLIGKTDLDIAPPELAASYRADDAEVMASRRNKVVTEPILIDGQPIWHETHKAPVIGEDGALLGTVGFAHDISERKRAEKALLLRNAALAALISGEPLADVLAMIGRTVEVELPGCSCSVRLSDSLPADDGPACSMPIVGADGRHLGNIVCSCLTTPEAASRVDGFLRQASQLAALVIEHQQRSRELSLSQETFRGIFDRIGQALFIQDIDGRFIDINSGAEQLFGYSRSGLIGQTHAFLHEQGLTDLPAIKQLMACAASGTPQVFESMARSNPGRIFPIEVRLHATQYFGQNALIAAIVDISERKNAALRLEIEHDLAQALAAGLQREEVMQALLKATLRFPDISAGGVYWRRPDGAYQLVVHAGLSAGYVENNAVLAADSALAQLARKGETICSCLKPTDECSDHRLLATPVIQNEGLGCLITHPIMVGGQPLACLSLAGRDTSRISSATLRSLAMLSRYFSQALQQLDIQEETRRLQHNLVGLFNTLTDFIFILDHDGNILHYNRAVIDDLGYGPATLIGQPMAAVNPENKQKSKNGSMSEIAAGPCASSQQPLLGGDGSQRQVETRLVQGQWDGKPALISISQDIGQRLAAEARQQLAASVFDNAHEGIMITDPAGIIVEVNSTFSELTGYARDEALGKTPDLLKSGHHEPAFYNDMWRDINEHGYWRGEIWNRKKSGEIFVEQLTISTVRDRDGQIANFVAIFSDITLIKQHQQRLEHLAHFDALTQLPNRMLLGDRMQLAMAQSERSGKLLAVCYLDLDNFKPINDQWGHSVGDYLLIEAAKRLKACVRGGDTVARLGGDEFVLLISGLENQHECEQAISRVIIALAQAFHLSDQELSISASIGVTLFPHDGSDADTLLRHADQAMYAAKQNGRNRYHLFDPEKDKRAIDRRRDISRIREGLTRGEFELYYQPKVDMRKGHVTGVEALIRWQHPEQGCLLPDRFLPLIEGTELAIELGDWVISDVLRQIDAWQEQATRLTVSINIAGNHLQHKGFSGRLGELLARHPNISPSQIELEILETAALEDVTNIGELFAECRQLGVSFSLDDFGTGYSSLTYFRRLPAETLKIDQSFIRNMLDDPDDLAIVEGVIGLTQAFHRKVIAEGVETVEHGLVLLLLGCDMAQGYGIAHPMPASELPAWIKQFRPDELWSLATAFQWSRQDLPMLISEVDHKRWKKSIYAFLETGDTETLPVMDHRACRFGQWYYSPESQRYASVESFKLLEAVHLDLHETGRQMIQAHEAGNSAALATLKAQLERHSGQLSDTILQVQAEVLMNAPPSRQ